jgi:glycosyltransferase involved in cell wall biosynthesis
VPRILHVLSQRPSLTGSGVTLEAIVRRARSWDQHVACGVPEGEEPEVGGLDPGRIHPLRFGNDRLPYPVPGMSDVMPYASTRFAEMSPAQVSGYRRAWAEHLSGVIASFEPDVVHAHHVWIVASLLKDLTRAPVIAHCHATGLRQLRLCAHLASGVAAGCARNDAFLVQDRDRLDELSAALDVPAERIRVVGAGYDEETFHARGRRPLGRIAYAGKYSSAKGLPWLLDAFEIVSARHPGLELHVAGSGSGAEAVSIERRMRETRHVVLHGQLSQAGLAGLLRSCEVMALASFYEGVPLVLVEAAASGCRLVATGLPGVVAHLSPHLGDALEVVPPPRLAGVDVPEREDLPGFVSGLARAIEDALARPPLPDMSAALEPFTWSAVFARIERVWRELVR